MHWSQRRLCRRIVESLSFPKMYYSMPINMFFIVKIHWETYFAYNPRKYINANWSAYTLSYITSKRKL
jgi:hypothetical protein